VPEAPDQPAAPAPDPLTINRILLLDPHGHDPTTVESITFDDHGIGVVRDRGQDARVLPWDAVVAHAVEPWAGGVIPEWWVDPAYQLPDRPEPSGSDAFASLLADPDLGGRQLPHAEAGAMISIQTRSGTYRFLRSGGDPYELAARVAEIAVLHQGPAGVSTVTTVAPDRARHHHRHADRAERRADRADRRAHRADRRADQSDWERARPMLVVGLVVVIVVAVVVILLQSAGVIHLPLLGGGAQSSAPVPISSR
jgi:hypothetical protein